MKLILNLKIHIIMIMLDSKNTAKLIHQWKKISHKFTQA